jgi:hypothetical protein
VQAAPVSRHHRWQHLVGDGRFCHSSAASTAATMTGMMLLVLALLLLLGWAAIHFGPDYASRYRC